MNLFWQKERKHCALKLILQFRWCNLQSLNVRIKPLLNLPRGWQGHMTPAVCFKKEQRQEKTTTACEAFQWFLKRGFLLRLSMTSRERVPSPKPDCGKENSHMNALGAPEPYNRGKAVLGDSYAVDCSCDQGREHSRSWETLTTSGTQQNTGNSEQHWRVKLSAQW